jgi:HAD superfamily hydrolase (TIGR01662 family)
LINSLTHPWLEAVVMIRVLIFDWGDTVMKVFPESSGPMAHWPTVEAVPGIEDALKSVQPRYTLVLASNAIDSGPVLVRDALERVGLDRYFHEVITAKELGASKPEPAYFKAILHRLMCTPEEAVMIGDKFEADISAAKKAGLWTIWYNPSGKNLSRNAGNQADIVVRSYPELDNALMLISSRSQRGRP